MTWLLYLAVHMSIHWSPDYAFWEQLSLYGHTEWFQIMLYTKFYHCILQLLPILYRRTVKLWMIMQTHAHSNAYKYQHRSKHTHKNTFLGPHECTPVTWHTHTHTNAIQPLQHMHPCYREGKYSCGWSLSQPLRKYNCLHYFRYAKCCPCNMRVTGVCMHVTSM